MRFWTSDTHFGHQNILSYSNRPFGSVQEMNEALVDNWNSVVSEDDIIFHLGDVAMGPWTEWDGILKRLNGYKILVVGNHDRVFRGMSQGQQDRFAEHYGDWFDEVHHNVRGVWLDDGTLVNMSHFPYDGDSHDGDRYTEFRQTDRGRVLIHGHVHREYHGDDEAERNRTALSRSRRGSKQLHVGVDGWGYAPVSEDRIIEILENC